MSRKVWIALLVLIISSASHAVAEERVLALTYDQDSLVFSEIIEGLDTFDVVRYPGYIYTTVVGEPQLPQGNIHVFVDTGAVVVDSMVITYFETDTLSGKYVMWPVQEPDSLGGTGLSRKRLDSSAPVYQSSSPYPDTMLELVHQGYLAGNRLAALLAYPVRYIPDDSLLIFHNNIQFSIYYHEGGTPPGTYTYRSEPARRSVQQMLASLVINPGDLIEFPLDELGYDYVIITSDQLSSHFQPLVDWKNKKGIKTLIKTTNDIYGEYTGHDNQEKIRNYICDLDDDHVRWVLLGGDVSVIPARLCRVGVIVDNVLRYFDIPCDLYYSDLDGDWDGDGDRIYGELSDGVDMYPDITVGRAPVQTQFEVDIFVDKVLTYERWSPMTDYSLEMLLMGFVVDWDRYTDCGGTKDYIDDRHVPMRFDPITKRYEGSTKQTVIDDLNEGKNLVNHMHNSGYDFMGISTENLTLFDVQYLTNGDRQSIVYSTGNDVAGFDLGSDCIAEYFLLRNSDGGAVAFVGNSRSGWFMRGEDPPLSLSAAYDIGYFCSLISDRNTHSGEALSCSKADEVGTAMTNRNHRYVMYGLNLLGDPEMLIWTTDLHRFEVDDQTLQAPVGTPTDFQLTVREEGGGPIEFAYVILSGCGVYETGITDDTGLFSQQVTPTETGHICVTVTNPGFIPGDYIPYVSYSKACNGYEDVIIRDRRDDDGRMPSWDINRNEKWEYPDPDMAYWASPDILLDQAPYDGVPGGGGEHTPKPGEINHLYAYVKNIGTATATSVTVELWWADYGIGIPQWGEDFHYIGEFEIPSLDPGETDMTHYVEWNVLMNQPRHTCVCARAECPTDPIVSNDSDWDNNIGWRNYAIERMVSAEFGDYEAKLSFKVGNPDDESAHDVICDLHLEEDWPGWLFELTSTDPGFSQIDTTRFLFADIGPGEKKEATLTITASGGIEDSTGIVHITGMIDGEPILGATAEFQSPYVTGIGESSDKDGAPAVCSLSQNYPNPFNPVTQINYALSEDCWVKLEIFNVLGQRVEILVDARQKAGYKTVRWNAGSLASGIYFYRLVAGDFVQTRKMVLLR